MRDRVIAVSMCRGITRERIKGIRIIVVVIGIGITIEEDTSRLKMTDNYVDYILTISKYHQLLC
jgi:hypothetical protein